MLELGILGLLKERSMHGYQLRKRLSETLGPFWQVSYGSLYPALKRLQAEGAVEVVFPKEEVGRRKNVYRITEAGERLFADLAESVGNDSDDNTGFLVRLAFFRYLKPETRIGLLEHRRALLKDRAADLKRKVTSYRERVDAYTLSLMRHGMDATEHDIRWLEDMIEQERRAVRGARRRRRALAEEGAET
ncbi:MAG: PadR family transcriptional regulator [Actinomycetota bacterium]|nr:PadR family transcriptional regulator [Actinomycetota bacterium]